MQSMIPSNLNLIEAGARATTVIGIASVSPCSASHSSNAVSMSMTITRPAPK